MKELDFFASVKRMDYDEAVEKGLITVMGAETDEEVPLQRHGSGQRQGRGGEGGRHLQGGLHPLPRHRL